MSVRARKLVFAAAAGAILLTVEAAADDAGERAFANELRILPAFTAQLDHTVVRGKESSRDTARLEMDPARASFRLCYETLPIEIWRVEKRVVTVPTGEGRPPPDRAQSAGKLAALLFMVGSGVASKHMDVTLEPKETQVDYVLSPRNDGNSIAWIRYEFDDVGLLRVSVLERNGELHRIVLSERKLFTESGPEAEKAKAAATLSI